MNKTNLGVALVTGASSGIGHATAKALGQATSAYAGQAQSSRGCSLRLTFIADGRWGQPAITITKQASSHK